MLVIVCIFFFIIYKVGSKKRLTGISKKKIALMFKI